MKEILFELELIWDNIKAAWKFWLLMILMGLTVFAITRGFPFLRNYNLNKLDSNTTAIVDTLILIKGMQDSQLGTQVVTKMYKIQYHFEADKMLIENEEDIQRRELAIEQRIKMRKLKKGDSLLVKFDKEHPNKAKLKIE